MWNNYVNGNNFHLYRDHTAFMITLSTYVTLTAVTTFCIISPKSFHNYHHIKCHRIAGISNTGCLVSENKIVRSFLGNVIEERIFDEKAGLRDMEEKDGYSIS